MPRRLIPLLTLSILSPLFAEILSGSTPPMEAAEPLTFLSLWGYYGSAIILIREFWIRKNGSYGSLMLLGFAYGVIEEGLCVKSWFNPHWVDLGILGTYGRIWGVNTVWAAWLTIFHGFMSVWVPIMVWRLLFPRLRNISLLRRREAVVPLIPFTLLALLIYLFLPGYNAPLVPYLLTFMLALFLIYFSIKFRFKPRKSNLLSRHPFLWGLVYSPIIFCIYSILPYTGIPFVVPITLGLSLAILFFYTQEGMDIQKIHLLLLGSLAFWLLFYDTTIEFMGYAFEMPLGVGMYLLLLGFYFHNYGSLIKS